MNTRFEDMDDDKFEAALRDQFDKMADLLMSKRRSYGRSNLTTFGAIGIIVRASDKIQRLKTMSESGMDRNVDGDSMDDAWRDLIGYGVLGLIYTRLERDRLEEAKKTARRSVLPEPKPKGPMPDEVWTDVDDC